MNRTAFYAAVAAGALLAPAAAYADTFSVTTDNSTFSNVVYDPVSDSPGFACTTSVTNTPSGPLQCTPNGQKITWPSGTLAIMHGPSSGVPGTSGIDEYYTGEYSNAGVDATNVEIGGLQMGTGTNPGGTATFDYNLVIQITSPTAATETYTYDLQVTTTSHSCAPHTACGGTNEISMVISGVLSPLTVTGTDGIVYTLSDFEWSYIVCPPGGLNNADKTCAPVAASYNPTSGTWTVDSNGVGQFSELILSADVTVPEPGSLALLGSGLAMFGWSRRRRAVKAA